MTWIERIDEYGNVFEPVRKCDGCGIEQLYDKDGNDSCKIWSVVDHADNLVYSSRTQHYCAPCLDVRLPLACTDCWQLIFEKLGGTLANLHHECAVVYGKVRHEQWQNNDCGNSHTDEQNQMLDKKLFRNYRHSWDGEVWFRSKKCKADDCTHLMDACVINKALQSCERGCGQAIHTGLATTCKRCDYVLILPRKPHGLYYFYTNGEMLHPYTGCD